MASINTIVKRKQYLWLGIVVDLHVAVHCYSWSAGNGRKP